jgi:polysaccharide pyruvyl transferase WcaK-like protein
MRLAHFYARTPNLGDRGAALGIQTLLRSVRSGVRFTEYDVDAGKIGWRETRRLARDFNGLVVGGGGLLYNRPRQAAKFYLNLSLDRYRKLPMPRCFFGVGLNAEYGGEGRWVMSGETRESIRLFMESTDLVGVRDPETLGFLEDMGIEEVMLTPCPSMLLLYDMKAEARDATIAVNVTRRTIGLDGVETLLGHVKAYAGQAGLRPVVVAHHTDEDRQCLEIAGRLGMDCFLPVSPENLMQFYKRQHVLVGMRGHSLIYATGASLPMLAVSYNIKCDAHMAMLGMQEYVIAHDRLADRQLVFSKLDRLLGERGAVEARLTAKKAEFYRLNREFARRWMSLVESRAGS